MRARRSSGSASTSRSGAACCVMRHSFRHPGERLLSGPNGWVCSMRSSSSFRSSRSARNADACSNRDSPPTSSSNANRRRRRSTARRRSRNLATGGNVSCMWASETCGGSVGELTKRGCQAVRILRREPELRLRRERCRPEPEVAVRLGIEPVPRATRPPTSCAGTPRGARPAPLRPPPGSGRRGRTQPPGTARAP